MKFTCEKTQLVSAISVASGWKVFWSVQVSK